MPQPINLFLITDDQHDIDICNELVNTYPDEFKLVGVATTGQSGIEQAKELKPDVALVDVSLSDLNCIEIVKALSPNLPDTEFIVMQVSDDAALYRLLMNIGVKLLLTKPLFLDYVREDVTLAFKWLTTRKERDDKAGHSPTSPKP